jgi:hypothetical protein
MGGDEVIEELKDVFAKVPRPGIPPGYVPGDKLGNPGWDEFTYHSALVFAEQLPDHFRRAFASPDKQIPDLLWHFSDSERLGVFSNRQIGALIHGLDVLQAEHADVMARDDIQVRLRAVRDTLERLAARPE